jgi:hypothetical protein
MPFRLPHDAATERAGIAAERAREVALHAELRRVRCDRPDIDPATVRVLRALLDR